MADNVDIIVQDTINDVVVNTAVVVETIDINVQVAVDEVTIISNPNEYIINVNRIIGEQVQSDWNETDPNAPDFIKNKPIIPEAVTKTSDLINDGEDGINPFITLNDIPAVTGFVPYTGATQDVNLGEFGVQLGNIEFDNTPTNIPTTAGSMYWNDADGTTDLILKGGNVTLQVGQEQVLRVVNKTATNVNLLESNYQAVRVTGAQGQRLKVDLAQATNDILSAETIGLVTENIDNNQEGFITTSGLVRGINTTGSIQSETWVDGDVIYLSPFTAGNVTKVKPTAPNHLVIIGYVVHAHITQGSIFVKVDNGYELDELHNVKITTPINNNVLGYNSTSEIWENKTINNVIGYTPENVANKSTLTTLGTSDTLYPTQNAVKVYADTKFTLPSFTNGSVLFSNGTTIAQDNANFFWDNTNKRLNIGGITSNTARLGIKAPGALSTDIALRVRNSTDTGDLMTVNGLGNLLLSNGIIATSTATTILQSSLNYFTHNRIASSGAFGFQISNYSTVSSFWRYEPGSGDTEFGNPLNYGINLFTNNLNRLRIVANGNVLINTTTDIPSSKLTIQSTTQGFLPPRMTTTQKNAIATPASGLVVYDTTLGKLCVRGASAWETITSI